MTYNEKSALVMIVALLCGSLGYLNAVLETKAALGELPAPSIPGLIGFTITLVVIAIAGHIVIAAFSPAEANASADERDKQILARAGHQSGWILGFGAVTALGHYLFHHDGNLLFYGVYASLVVSQLAEYIFQLCFYRLQA